MRLRESSLRHVRHQTHLMCPIKIGAVQGQSCPTPNELEILSFLYLIERFEGSPEASHNLMGIITVGIFSDAAKLFNIEYFSTACSLLDRLPLEILKYITLT